jgi:N4-(beta-N-acetylglucosaminyl)-L-asparaginase
MVEDQIAMAEWLDACIMDENANIGSVACLEFIKHPISVARAVMEKRLT